MRSHQRLTATTAILAVLVLSLSGCTQILSLIEGVGGSTNTPAPVTPAADSIRVVISELSANMVKGGFTAAQASAVSKSAQDNVTLSQVSETDFANAIPVAVGGAEAGLSNPAFTTEKQKIDAVGVITTSFMNSLKGRFEVTSRSSRALADNAQVVSKLLARISQAAVKNLANTGITSSNLGKTAGDIVGNMITGLNGGGVNKALVSEALVQITQAAVATLKDSGLSTTQALGAAVQAVTKGAVSAVATITVEGVNSTDFPALTNQITQGASESLGKISTSATEVADFVKAVATGSSEGIVVVAKTATTVSAATLSSMVQAATSGTTTGVLKSDFVNASQDASSLIGKITEATSASLSSSANAVSTLSQTEIQKAVTVGASAAAQIAVPNGGLDKAALAAAIVLKDSAGGTVTVVTADIDVGVSLGTNVAPKIQMIDVLTVSVGAAVNLDASATTDDKDTVAELTFSWTLATKPQGSTATLVGSATAKPSFLPTVVGTYLVALKVTDRGLASSEQFVTVYVLASAGSVTYGGKTAETRLADAKLMGKAGDIDLARDELLIILGHYPESTLTPEINYWLAKAYQNLGDPKAAFGQFEKTLTLVDATTAIGARARVDYAAARIWKNRGTFNPKPLLDEVVNAQANTPIAAEAQAKLASLTRANGRQADGSYDQTAVNSCITQLGVVLALPPASLTNEARFDAQSDLAWAYFDAKDFAKASTEFLKLPALAQNNGADSLTSVNSLRFNAAETYWRFAINSRDGQYLTAAQSGLVTLSQDASQDADLRLKAVRDVMEYLIWDKPAPDTAAKKADLKQAVALPTSVLAATAAVSDSKTRAQQTWVYTRLGNANENLRNRENDESLQASFTDAAIVAYKKAQDLGWGYSWGYRPAGEAMVNAAGQYHWNKRAVATHNDTALALVARVLAEHPTDGDQWARAFAQFRQGEILRDVGNEERDQNGKDYLTTYNKAIVAFSRVTKALFPTVSTDQWFFRDSLNNLGEIYMNMRNFVAGRSYFTLILNDATVAAGDKVWSQVSLANSYGEEFLQYVQEGNDVQATALWNAKAAPAFDAVATYKDGTGFINQGEPWARALLQKGRYLRDAANNWRWDQGADSTVWTPLYEAALVAFQQVTVETFANLPSDGWEFNEAIRGAADCQFKLGTFAQGRTALRSLLGLMDQVPPKAPTSGRWGVMKQLANSFRDEADVIDRSDSIEDQATRVGLDEQAIAETKKMYDVWVAQVAPSPDATDSTAWALTDTGWAALDAANTLGWDRTDDGLRGYSASDWEKINGYEAQLTKLLNWFTTTPALLNANGGASLGRLYRILGHWYQDMGYNLPGNAPWADRKARFDQAWAYYEKCIATVASEPDDVGASLKSEVGIKAEYARNATDLAVRTAAFEATIDLAAAVMVNPRVSINEVAGACITVGQLYRDLHSSHALRPDQLGGVGITGMDKPGEWQASVKFWVLAIATKSDNFSKVSDGWAIEEAQKLIADANLSGSINVTVQ